MKTPLKYGTPICLTNSFNCTLVAPDGIFLASFFLCSYTLSMFVRTEIRFVPVFVRSDIQSVTLLHRAIMTLQFFELTSRCFAVVYCFHHVDRSNISRNGNTPPRFAVRNIRFFVGFFLIFFFSISCPCRLVLSFIGAQTVQLRWLSLSKSNLSRDDAS